MWNEKKLKYNFQEYKMAKKKRTKKHTKKQPPSPHTHARTHTHGIIRVLKGGELRC